MFWRGKQRTSSRRNVRSPGRLNARLLRVEPLESRHLLSGVVNISIAPALPAGDMQLQGDGANNSIQIQSGTAVSDAAIVVRGLNGTLLQINGAPAASPVTIPGIFGSIQVQLLGGADSFEFVGAGVATPSTVQGNLRITNDSGGDSNVIHDTAINGNLIVDKVAGAGGSCNLELAGVTVVGNTTVENQTVGGSGDSTTFITNSHLQGGGGIAFSITNGYGFDFLSVQSSDFGTGAFPGPIVTVANGDGASEVTFTAGTTALRTKIFGGLTMTNGTNLPGTLDQVHFINTDVLGAVAITDAGGNTRTDVQNSKLGTWLTLPAPVTISNNAGSDKFTMTGSEMQWGLEIINDLAAGGASTWGSETTIDTSKIGTSPLGPVLPPPALPGDGLYISGDSAADLITITGTTIGGNTRLVLYNGNNRVDINTVTTAGLTVNAGTGNDDLRITQCTISVALNVVLGPGNNRMKVKGISTLPNPALGGILLMNGGPGLQDKFFGDLGVIPPLGLWPTFEILEDWTY